MKSFKILQNDTADFLRKASSYQAMNDMFCDGQSEASEYRIEEVVILSDEEFDGFKENLFGSYEWLKGKGGVATTTDPYPDVEMKIWQYTKEELAEYYRGAYRKCIAVTSPNRLETFAVDPQGYDYARYIAEI